MRKRAEHSRLANDGRLSIGRARNYQAGDNNDEG
jgi:hypothetical protein